MKKLMISILTAIVLSLMMQPVSAQNLQLEKGVTHPHTMKMVDDSRFQLVIETFFAENTEQLHAIAGNVLKDSPMANMAAECMQICHGDEEAGRTSAHQSMMSENMHGTNGHHDAMEEKQKSAMHKMKNMHEKCMAMMHDGDHREGGSDSVDREDESEDHDNHH